MCLLPLPDDSYDVMHVLCLLLHHRHTEIYYEINVAFLQKMALAVEKYACASPLMYWANTTTGSLRKSALYLPDDACLLLVAHYFDSPQHFKRISRDLVYHNSQFSTVDEYGEENWSVDEITRMVMPPSVLCTCNGGLILFPILFLLHVANLFGHGSSHYLFPSAKSEAQ